MVFVMLTIWLSAVSIKPTFQLIIFKLQLFNDSKHLVKSIELELSTNNDYQRYGSVIAQSAIYYR